MRFRPTGDHETGFPKLTDRDLLVYALQILIKLEKNVSDSFAELSSEVDALKAAVAQLGNDAQPGLDALKKALADAQATVTADAATIASDATTIADLQAQVAAHLATAAAAVTDIQGVVTQIQAVDTTLVPPVA